MAGCVTAPGNSVRQAEQLAPGSERHEVKAESGRGGMPVVQVTIDGQGPFRFGIDTGAPGPLRLDTAVADRLGLQALRYDVEGDPSGENEFTVPVVRIKQLGIGTFTKAELEANVMDLKGLGFEYDGLFGMDAFADHLLTLDYARGTVVIESGSLSPANGVDIIDYELTQDGFIQLPLRVDGEVILAILDTGQAVAPLILSEAVAKSVGSGSPVQAGKARTVSKVIQMYEVPVTADVVAGGIRLPIEKVRYPSLSGEANIGSKALAGTVLRIDQRNRRIQFSIPQQ